MQSLTVFLPSLHDAVLEAKEYNNSYGEYTSSPYFSIDVFRPGSWINHVIGFKSEVQQLKDEATKKEKQARLLAKQLEQQKKIWKN